MEVPLPLNRGCQIDITLPETLKLGPEMQKVVIGGMFGSVREADISLDASQNLIHIDNACMTYRQNAAKASFDISALVNPGYVITSQSFQISISDIDSNPIVETSGGIDYTTTPGALFF